MASSAAKRKNQDEGNTNEDEVPAKSLKLSASEFRTKVKGADPLSALKQFLKDDKEDKIEEYIREGGSISELLAILNNFELKKNIPQAIPVFQAITIFIIKSMNVFPERSKELTEECRQLLNLHLTLIHNMLTAVYSPRQKKVALKLLTAVVSCNDSLAWEILTYLKLTRQDIEALSFARKQTDPTSVREHFIKFLMAFLIDQPNELKRKFISQKGMLTSIFGGLKADSYSDIMMVLTTLKSSIVDEKGISKSLKLSVFNTASLCHLVGVYSWDPRANASHPSQNELNLVGRDEVRQCLHELLIVLLTNVKMGVVFNDPSIGSTNREFNELVTTVISGFGKPWGDEMREDLFTKMLSACPDVIKQAYRQMDSFFAEIDSPRWIQGIQFYTKLLDHLDIKVSMLPLKTRTNLIKTVFAPPHLLSKLVKSLESENVTCRNAALVCLNTCLKRLLAYKEYYLPSVINNYLISNLSCTDSIMHNIELLCNYNDEDGSGNKSLLSALDCLLLGYSIHPQLLDSVRYKKKYYEMLVECLSKVKSNLSNIRNVLGDTNQGDLDNQHLQVQIKLSLLKIIELLLIVWPLDSSQENFEFWLEDLSECISPEPEIVKESLSVIKHILNSTGYFLGRYQNELDICMYCLSNCLTVDSVKLIVKSIKYSSTHSKTIYADLLRAEEIITVQEQSPTLTLSLDDYIMASSEGDEEVYISDKSNVFSLSVPFLAMLKILHDDQTIDDSHNFVVSLVVHLLHRQVNTDVFVALLKLYSNSKAASLVLKYAESWNKLSGQNVYMPPSFSSESIFCLTSKYLLNPDETEQPLDISGLLDIELELLTFQILFSSVRGCNISQASTLLSAILHKSSSFVSVALNYQPLLDTFHPRNELTSPLNSTLLVMNMLESLGSDFKYVLPYQHRLAFEIRHSLRHRKRLNDCPSSMSKVINIIKLTNTDIKWMFEHCFPLPKLLREELHVWRPIQEYLLKEGIRLNIKLSIEKLSDFLSQFYSSFKNKRTEEDTTFLDSLSSYLEHNYAGTAWSKQMTQILSDLLELVIKSDDWNENLSVFLYKQAPVDISYLSLDRLSVLLDSAIHRLTTIQLSKLIASKKSDILDILISSNAAHWVDKLSSSLLLVNFGETASNLEDICTDILKKKDKIHVSISNVKLMYSIFSKANKSSELFSIVHDYLLQPSTLKDQKLGECLSNIMEEIILDKDCSLNVDLVKVLLASGLKDPFPALIHLLRTAVKMDRANALPKETFSLLTSHSLFLSTMLSRQTKIKYEVLMLIETLLSEDNSLMKSSHLPVYFSAYNATLSLHDQVLLQILKMYENSGINLSEYKPYVWGEAAAQKYSVSQKRKRLDDDDVGCPTIQLIDLDTVYNTIKYFPVNRTLETKEIIEVEKGSEIYDLVFLLGALSQVVGPDSSIYPSQIPCAGVTSLAFLSLGSKCPGIRAAGYHILHRHYTSLTERSDDQLWSHLIEKLQRSICGKKNAKLSGLLSVFLARATLIMSEPYHPLYRPVHKFTLVKPTFELNVVPAFLEFFHSPDPINGRMLQSWILEVIRDGLWDQDDLQVILSSFTSKLLLDFYSSKLSTHKTQALIEEILERCIACDSKRHLLINEYSLIPWLLYLKKYKKALDLVPSYPRYSPLKKFISHCLQSSTCADNAEYNHLKSTLPPQIIIS